MATYKVIQDIEAEDHILGPLTFRQFVFGLIAVFLFYICFFVTVKHLWFLLVIFLPPALFFGFFALPFGRDQPTEVWALAKLRFLFMSRRRVWDQSGVKELVTITVPKKVERVLTNGLSQTEVKSRLSALAETLDTRGWAIKHASPGAYGRGAGGGSDRLVGFNSLPQEVPNTEVLPSDDILDETSSPIARQFETMIDRSSQAHRQELLEELKGIRAEQPAAPAAAGQASNYWFMTQRPAGGAAVTTTAVTGAVPAAAVGSGAVDDSALAAQLAARANSRQASFGNMRTVRPAGTQAGGAAPKAPAPVTPAAAPTPANGRAAAVTAPDDPAILSLASNDDLNVATLAREAKKKRGGGQSPDEVVISLH